MIDSPFLFFLHGCIHEQAQEFSGITDGARRLLASMARRDVRQKYMIAFLAVILIVAISVTVYFTQKK